MDIQFKYLVSRITFADDKECHVILCNTLEEAKKVGEQMAGYDSAPHIGIWINDGVGSLKLVTEGFIPDPTFKWCD
jgi:hypothetical protein